MKKSRMERPFMVRNYTCAARCGDAVQKYLEEKLSPGQIVYPLAHPPRCYIMGKAGDKCALTFQLYKVSATYWRGLVFPGVKLLAVKYNREVKRVWHNRRTIKPVIEFCLSERG